MTVLFFRWYHFTIGCTVLISISKVYGQRTADWMSGKHGVGFRIPGGVNQETAVYDISELVNQIKNEIPEVTWILLGLSSGAYGDRYNSPHSILTDLNRASTPRQTENVDGLPSWFEINADGLTNFTLEDYPDRDLYGEIADAFHAEGFKIIAYMASQGPTFLKQDETRAYDYDNKSVYVDSVAECNVLTNGDITDGKCSPSARRWRNYVIDEYGDDEESTLMQAYAELILGEYAQKFDGKEGRPLIDGWWFDQGKYLDIPRAYAEIMAANPNATIAFNKGPKIPLANNNRKPPSNFKSLSSKTCRKAIVCSVVKLSVLVSELTLAPYEDYTGGHPNPITETPPYDEINEDIIISIENTTDGYFESQGSYSLGHAFQMTNDAWNNGDLVWNGTKLPQAIDWMSRVVFSEGAWTWNVKRSFYPTKLHEDDIALLKDIYAGVAGATRVPSASPSDPVPSASPSDPIPSASPSDTISPTTEAPTISPTTQAPTISPSTMPSVLPSIAPTVWPSGSPTETSTTSPSRTPSTTPSYVPTLPNTYSPSIKSLYPSSTPSAMPSLSLSVTPSSLVSLSPSGNPTTQAVLPTSNPSIHQSLPPTSTCEETSSDIFLLKIKKDGKPKVKSCYWLNSLPLKKQRKICQQQTGPVKYKNPADVCKLTCGIGCTPTNVPSLSPTLTCEDSWFPISHQGNSISCAQVAANDACSNRIASSHCPFTCDACEEFKCKNSLAPWRGNGRKLNCDFLASIDPEIVAYYCALSYKLSTTCRATCEFCSN